MKLRTYLNSKKVSKSSFAKELGVTRETVSKWTLGDYAPSRRNAQKIIKLTEGKVTLSDLMGI